MIKIKHIFIGLILIFFCLSSCSPVYRHSRLVKKYPFLHQTDSVKLTDTLRFEIPKIQVDTVFQTNMLIDTVYITKDQLKIKMFTVHDSIYIDAKCDTIYVEKIVTRNIPVKYYVQKDHWFDQFKSWLKWVFIVLLIPHLVWLTNNDYITITYALARTGLENSNLLDHITYPLIFLGKQIGILIPFFLMLLFLNNKFKNKFNFKILFVVVAFSIFEEKVIESLSLELDLGKNNKIIVYCYKKVNIIKC